LIAQTPGCASLARSSLSALPGRGWVSTSQTHVYKVHKFLTNAGTAEHFRVSPPEAVCLNGIIKAWGDEMRAVRIDEFLGSGRMFTIVDMMRLQQDELSIPARNLVPLLRDLPISDAAVSKAREDRNRIRRKMDAFPSAVIRMHEPVSHAHGRTPADETEL
jgi:hypothetical protein